MQRSSKATQLGRVLAVLWFVLVPIGAYAQSESLQDLQTHRLDLMDAVDDLYQRIEEADQVIQEALTTDAQAEAAAFRERVEQLINAIAGSGGMLETSARALDWARTMRDDVRTDHLLTEEQRSFLLGRWDTTVIGIEGASADLVVVFNQLLPLLRSLVNREHYIRRLIEIQAAEAILQELQFLVDDVRSGTETIDTLLIDLEIPAAPSS